MTSRRHSTCRSPFTPRAHYFGFGQFGFTHAGTGQSTAGRLQSSDVGPFSDPGDPPRRPEPSTWAMMLIGFAGLGYAGYRKARAPRAA